MGRVIADVAVYTVLLNATVRPDIGVQFCWVGSGRCSEKWVGILGDDTCVSVFEVLLGTEISKGRVTCLICLNGSVLLKLLDVRSMVVGVGVVVVSISVLIAAV